MRADLDLLCISVYCTADDLLPARPGNGRRKLSDAEIVTLCVAQALMGIPSDRRFLRAAKRQLGHLFPWLPTQDALHKRRARLADTIEWLCGLVAAQCPGAEDDLVLLDSTPVECGRSLETTRRSALADVCGYGYCKSHSRWFWGMRLHLLCAPDGTPRAATLVSADRPEREVALPLLARALHGGETIVCDKGYAGREFEQAVRELGGLIVRPARKDAPDQGIRLAKIRQRIESVFLTYKDLLSLERHGARTPANLRARIATRLLALAACIRLNHHLGRPSRAIADYTA
ncbi:MAG: IS982 family transposase [Thermoleophilia bacterium]|nr:IS982 family transposase [Thermoleophilia bacterium]